MNALIQIYTGDGKGKTSACIGAAVRAAGAGMRILFTQFLKDGSSSEIKILENIPGITYIKPEKCFGFIKYMNSENKEKAKKFYADYLEKIKEELSAAEYEMLIIDEFMAAYNYDMIDKELALEFIKNKKNNLELILTGRDVPDEIAKLSDYISEIKKIKHPFDKGIKARIGIEL